MIALLSNIKCIRNDLKTKSLVVMMHGLWCFYNIKTSGKNWQKHELNDQYLPRSAIL